MFDEPRIASMAEHWRNLLHALLADPQQRLSELPLLDGAAQQRLLDGLAPVAGEQRLDHCVHVLFAEQARMRPEAIALTFAGQHVSYACLLYTSDAADT